MQHHHDPLDDFRINPTLSWPIRWLQDEDILLYCYCTAMYVHFLPMCKEQNRLSDCAGALCKLFRLECISKSSLNGGETRSGEEPGILHCFGPGSSCQHCRIIDHISTDKDLRHHCAHGGLPFVTLSVCLQLWWWSWIAWVSAGVPGSRFS